MHGLGRNIYKLRTAPADIQEKVKIPDYSHMELNFVNHLKELEMDYFKVPSDKNLGWLTPSF